MPWTGENGLEVIGEETRDIKDEMEIWHVPSRSKEFDTLGTWDTRLNVALDEVAMLKTGQVIFAQCFGLSDLHG